MNGARVPEFWLEVEHARDRALVRVTGELDLATAPKLGRTIEAEAARGAAIVVDLARLWFADGGGVRRLLRAHDHVLARGVRMALTPGPAAVMQVFALAGLMDRLVFLAHPMDPFERRLPF